MVLRKYITLLTLLISVILVSCNRDKNHPGWDYFPDMFYSTAYETYAPNPNFEDGMTMRVPVDGTAPRDYTPFEYTIDAESRIKAGEELVNPVTQTDEALARGKEAYSIFCAGCHGVAGMGDGYLHSSGLYAIKPRSLVADAARILKDGEIFHSITAGFGSMGAHGSQVSAVDTWKIVLYVRQMQEGTSGGSDIN